MYLIDFVVASNGGLAWFDVMHQESHRNHRKLCLARWKYLENLQLFFFPVATFVNTLKRDHGEHRKHIQETNANNAFYFYVYMIYTHFSVYIYIHTLLPFCWPNTHSSPINSPINSWPTHQFHLKLFSRGAAAAFRAFGRKLPQNSTWSGQNGLLAKKKKSLFALTTCKGCRFVKVGWFRDWWFVEGDPGWGMNDRWSLDMSQSSKARKFI